MTAVVNSQQTLLAQYLRLRELLPQRHVGSQRRRCRVYDHMRGVQQTMRILRRVSVLRERSRLQRMADHCCAC